MKIKGTVIATLALVAALAVFAGVAVAAGTSGGEKRAAGLGASGESLRFACRNLSEGDRIRAENRCGVEEECPGDCDRVRERLQDGTCDGDGTQTRNRAGQQSLNPGEPGGQAAQAGECPGDCDRVRERLQDGTCDGDGTQTRNRAGE